MSRSPLALALEIDGDGAHRAAWRRAAHTTPELLTPRRVRQVAQIAERAGFTLVTLDDDLLSAEAARAWGRPPVTGDAQLTREASDAVRVVRALWDSWEDAVIRDVASRARAGRHHHHPRQSRPGAVLPAPRRGMDPAGNQ